MARKQESVRIRKERKVPENLTKFLSRAGSSGDGLVIYAFLNQMGVSRETLHHNIPHLQDTSHAKKALRRHGFNRSNIFEKIISSTLPQEMRDEMVNLLFEKISKDADDIASSESKNALMAKIETLRRRTGVTEALRNNPDAQRFVADRLLAGMSEEEAIAGLKEAFDIDAFSFILRSAFDVLSARDYVKKIYPDIDESKLAGVSVSRSRSNAATERTVKYGLRDKALLKEAPNLPDAMALASFTRNLQNFIVKNRRINHPPPVTIDPIVTLRQSYGSEGKMTTLIISVNADDDTQKALGWFNALSSGLKNWVDTKGEADTAFDPFVVFNEGNEKIGCVIELRQAGYSKASASYRTNIGYLEFKGK